MDKLRTPDERFENLPGYGFSPNYTEVPDGEGASLRIHHVEEGPPQGEVVLCMHGQPTWSYLYRTMLPVFTAAGCRVLAPDLVGFGRSDKPTRREDYSYQRHVDWMTAWLEARDLRNATLFCQDWGGLIGLRLVAAVPERFARVVVANTGMPDGTGIPPEAGPAMRKLYDSLPVVKAEELGPRFAATDGPPGFMFWRKYCAESPDFSVADVMRFAGGSALADEIVAAYSAPFPDASFEAGARQFPSLVPIFPDDPAIPANQKAWEVLRSFEKPLLTAFSDGDPVTRGGEKRFQQEVPGAQGRQHPTIAGAGHFLQEDKGPEVAEQVLQFMKETPLG
jgi:haloalkane dehalogenase